MKLQRIGMIVRPYRLRGELLISKDGFAGSLSNIKSVHIGHSPNFSKEYALDSIQQSPLGFIVKLRGISSKESAAKFVGSAAYISEVYLETDKEQYLISELTGCTVLDESGKCLGVLTDAWILPANDVWVVTTPDDKELLLPVIDEVILQVSIVQKTIVARLLTGLDEL